MRFLATAAAIVTALLCPRALAQGLVEYMEVQVLPNPGGPGFSEFLFVSSSGDLTLRTAFDDDNDGFAEIEVPEDIVYKGCHAPDCKFVDIGNIPPAAGFDQTGQVPILVDLATGVSLKPTIPADQLASLPTLSPGQTFQVTGGASPLFSPKVVIYDPGVPFTDIPCAQLRDPDGYPLFTGVARVERLQQIRVFVVPACQADVTTTNANPGDPGYGIPDSVVNGADLSFFVELWLAACP